MESFGQSQGSKRLWVDWLMVLLGGAGFWRAADY